MTNPLSADPSSLLHTPRYIFFVLSVFSFTEPQIIIELGMIKDRPVNKIGKQEQKYDQFVHQPKCTSALEVVDKLGCLEDALVYLS